MKNRFHLNDPLPYHINCHFISTVPNTPDIQDVIWFNLCRFLSEFLSGEFQIHSLVLMSNHFHLLCSNKKVLFKDVLNKPKAFIPLKLKQDLEFSLHFTQIELFTEYIDIEFNKLNIDPITNFSHYKEAYRYIYMNPVNAKLAHKAHHYRYSTLHNFLGYNNSGLFVDNMNLIADPFNTIQWIHKSDQRFYDKQREDLLKFHISFT